MQNIQRILSPLEVALKSHNVTGILHLEFVTKDQHSGDEDEAQLYVVFKDGVNIDTYSHYQDAWQALVKSGAIYMCDDEASFFQFHS